MKKLVLIAVLSLLFVSCEKELSHDTFVTVKQNGQSYVNLLIYVNGKVESVSEKGDFTVPMTFVKGETVRVKTNMSSTMAEIKAASEYKTYYGQVQVEHDFTFTVE
jgi:hypothetical protein